MTISAVLCRPAASRSRRLGDRETRDLAVRYIKIVVTDDQGRFVVPDLPQANYQVWARGYGLVDSDKTTSTPGKLINIAAKPAPDAAAAAKIYPAIYWYAMMKIPGEDQFRGKSAIPASLTQSDWLDNMKSNGCVGCHQLGQLSTRVRRSFSKNRATLTRTRGCAASIRSGRNADDSSRRGRSGRAAFKYLGDWTQRVGARSREQAGAPAGAERNIVITLRDWMNEAISARPRCERSALSGRQCEWSLWLAHSSTACRSRSGEEHGDSFRMPVRIGHARARTWTRRRRVKALALRLLGRRDDLGRGSATTIHDRARWTRGSPRPSPSRRIRLL
jgi:hypothetical protein